MKITKLYFFLFFVFIFTSCGGSSSKQSSSSSERSSKRGSELASGPEYVKWEKVPQKYSPRNEVLNFDLSDAPPRIFIDIWGFSKDVRVRYSDQIHENSAALETYFVSNPTSKTPSYGPNKPDLSMKSESLHIDDTGSRYVCNIDVRNGLIKDLSGGCYVRVVLVLPVNSKIEIYSVGKLLSRRFIPMSNTDFLELIEDTRSKDEKRVVIRDYIYTYTSLNKKPSLVCDELDVVLSDATWDEEKNNALRMLHIYITDRENLEQLIKDNYSHFDQEEARKIVGLN